MNFFNLKLNRINLLPGTAGVYCFRNGKKILYIGKAVNIKERAKQHKDLLGLAKQIGYIKTDSEIEALLLEARLIKKYRPKYNVAWKDDKNYFYVAITKKDFPRVLITHQPREKAEYIGPFVEGTSLKRTLTFLRKVFPYYTGKSHPKGSCLWCDLKLCPGPNPVKSDYRKNIKNLISVLKGKSGKVLKNLKEEMEKSSVSQDYEKAAKTRDQIGMLEKVIFNSRVFESVEVDPQQIFRGILNVKKTIRRIEAYDISNIQGKEAVGSMVVFTQGKPDKNQYRKFKIKMEGKPNDIAMIKEVLLRRFAHPEWPYPDLILIDGGKGHLNVAKRTKNKEQKTKNIPVMALAKKENKLYIENKKEPLLLKTMSREIFNLILQLRGEAHRFAISYHHKLRKKALLKN